jgi:rhamnosyltransferase
MDGPDAPLCSVVIPTLNAGPQFAETLAAVRSQRDVGAIDLLVLDSQSGDATVALARQAQARVRTIVRSTFEHGHTRNVGAALARGRFVAFLTQDAQPADERWLAPLVESLERERAVGAYGRVLPRPGCSPLVERCVRDDLVFSTQRLVKRIAPEQLARLSPFERRVFFHFNNVSSCVRRDFFAHCPFPSIAFGEDLAWGERVLTRGETIVYEPDSRVLHSHESDLREDHARHAADAVLMRTLFGVRNRDGWRDCLPAWRAEVRRDFEYVAAAPLPWSEKLRHLLYSPLLRAAQIHGQWAGTHAPLVAPPRHPEALPRVEQVGG